MKKLLKPIYLAFYALVLVSFFVIGMYYAKITGAAENKGLAGGAIILGYGVLFGSIAFIISLFIARKISLKYLKIINWILLISTIVFWSVKYFEYQVKTNKTAKVKNLKTTTNNLNN